MKASEATQQLENGDIIVITPNIDFLLQQCCFCGKWHELKFKRQSNGDIHLSFFSLNKEPDREILKKMKVLKPENELTKHQ
ncbi:MAG: hypothetical protein IIC76_14005 [Bacteroidetes bacterium]|nr:hypothetical protein [Bacteroidota bacterium]